MGRQSRQRSWRCLIVASCVALVVPSLATEARAHGGAYQPPPQPGPVPAWARAQSSPCDRTEPRPPLSSVNSVPPVSP